MKEPLLPGLKVTIETRRVLENRVTLEDPAQPPIPVRLRVEQLHASAQPAIAVDELRSDDGRRINRIVHRLTRAQWDRLKGEMDLLFNTFEETFDK